MLSFFKFLGICIVVSTIFTILFKLIKKSKLRLFVPPKIRLLYSKIKKRKFFKFFTLLLIAVAYATIVFYFDFENNDLEIAIFLGFFISLSQTIFDSAKEEVQ